MAQGLRRSNWSPGPILAYGAAPHPLLPGEMRTEDPHPYLSLDPVRTRRCFETHSLDALLSMRVIGLSCRTAFVSLRVSVFSLGRDATAVSVCQSRNERRGFIRRIATTLCASSTNARSIAASQIWRSAGEAISLARDRGGVMDVIIHASRDR